MASKNKTEKTSSLKARSHNWQELKTILTKIRLIIKALRKTDRENMILSEYF